MPQIAVASLNPVKIEAVKAGFQRMFPGVLRTIEGVNMPELSLPSQPLTDAETLYGAEVRAKAVRDIRPGCDTWIGIEGGIDTIAYDTMICFAWAVIIEEGGIIGKARSGSFMIPAEVARLIRSGLELGDADDQVFGKSNSKQINGALGLLTNDVMSRTSLYTDMIAMALIPFKNANLTFLSVETPGWRKSLT